MATHSRRGQLSIAGRGQLRSDDEQEREDADDGPVAQDDSHIWIHPDTADHAPVRRIEVDILETRVGGEEKRAVPTGDRVPIQPKFAVLSAPDGYG